MYEDLVEFMVVSVRQVLDADDWLQANLKLARVTEDPIDILLKNGTISFMDLPGGAYNKVITRQSLGSEMSYVEALFCSDKDNYLSDSMVLRVVAVLQPYSSVATKSL